MCKGAGLGGGAHACVSQFTSRYHKMDSTSRWRPASHHSRCQRGQREHLVTQYLQRNTSAALRCSKKDENGEARVWTDIDWAGKTESRRWCSGGWVELERNLSCD